MAYCMLASLPPIIGLHTATVAPFFFAALGTTRNVLSVGPSTYTYMHDDRQCDIGLHISPTFPP